MRTDLMLKGADLLEADALNPEGIKFDLNTWAADARVDLTEPFGVNGLRTFGYKEDAVIPINCGTQACAAGLFALSGAFKDQGFSYEITNDGRLRLAIQTRDAFGIRTVLHDWEAVAHLFAIEEPQAWKLFSADNYPPTQRKGAVGELAVAARMREMVAEHLARNAGVINQSDDT